MPSQSAAPAAAESDKLKQQQQQQHQKQRRRRRRCGTVTPSSPSNTLQQQQHQQENQLNRKRYNLNDCALPPLLLLPSPSPPSLTLFAILMLVLSICHNHALQISAAAIVPPLTDQSLQMSPEPQQHNGNNKNDYSSQHLSLPLKIPLETANHTFKSLSIIDGLTAETEVAMEVDPQPIFDFGMPRNITGRTGQAEAILKCRVDRLNDKSVSWIRKRDLHILTVGTATYTSDKRFEVTDAKDSREWTLHVKAPQPRDSGIYECQVNTEPKISMAFQLNIIEISPDSKAIISGPADLHFKVGSAIILNCIVQQPSVKDIGPIYWYRGEYMITPFDNGDNDDDDDDGTAAGAASDDVEGKDSAAHDLTNNDIQTQEDFAARIAMESQLGDTLKSRLRISNAQTTDTGNYSCQPTTARSASVMVHVINDENPAAMQKSSAVALHVFPSQAAAVTIVCSLVHNVALLTGGRGAGGGGGDVASAASTVIGSIVAACRTLAVLGAVLAVGAVSGYDVALVIMINIMLFLAVVGREIYSFLFAASIISR